MSALLFISSDMHQSVFAVLAAVVIKTDSVMRERYFPSFSLQWRRKVFVVCECVCVWGGEVLPNQGSVSKKKTPSSTIATATVYRTELLMWSTWNGD